MLNNKPPITVAPVLCPNCGQDRYAVTASGPDYDNHCCGDQIFHLVQCDNCGIHYLNPRPTVDTLPIIYSAEEYYSFSVEEDLSSIILKARETRDRQKITQAMSILGKSPDQIKVLDIGTGDGQMLRTFKAMGVPPENLYGMELDQAVVDILNKKGYQGILGRIEDSDLPDASFDVVAMIQVIEHVADPKDVMRTLHRILKPGGVFIIETPNMDAWDRRFFRHKLWGGYHFPRHWTLFNRKTITRMLNEVGFDVAHYSTPAAAVLWAWSVNHFLQERKMPRGVLNFFSMNNPLALGIFYLLEFIPSRMGWSAGMRVIAKRK